MKILITGGSGFIGSHLVQYFKKLNWEVFAPSSKELDLMDRQSCIFYFELHSFDVVIHAATPHYVPNAGIFVENQYEKICQMFDNLYSQTTQIRCIELGSGADMSESELGQGKRYMRNIIVKTSNWTYLRLLGVFGEREHSSRFFSSLFREAQTTKTITIKNPNGLFSWIDVKDFCEIVRLFCIQPRQYKEYNICNSELKTLGYWGDFLSKTLNAKLILEQKPPSNYYCDNTRLVEELHPSFTPMKESIYQYYKQYLEKELKQ
jgi:nucleoside-diphosphate-sugar epimerase